MAIQKTPATYTTSDGKDWDTKKEAERHEAFLEASRAFEAAQRELLRANEGEDGKTKR